jgi:hypothetical protein
MIPNDSKLGLVVGLGLVIAVAVVYFRNDSLRKREESPAATAVKPASATRQPPPRGQARSTRARPAVQDEQTQQALPELSEAGAADAPKRQP